MLVFSYIIFLWHLLVVILWQKLEQKLFKLNLHISELQVLFWKITDIELNVVFVDKLDASQK